MGSVVFGLLVGFSAVVIVLIAVGAARQDELLIGPFVLGLVAGGVFAAGCALAIRASA